MIDLSSSKTNLYTAEPVPITFPKPDKWSAWKKWCQSIFKAFQTELTRQIASIHGKVSKRAASQTEEVKKAVSKQFEAKPAAEVEPTLPIDPSLKLKQLENGLTYYVRNHTYPFPQKAYLRLVVRTGHINETKQERGVAHLLEHITQTETKHFAKGEIDAYLDSKGISWGKDTNAYTADQETVYRLDIPLDDPEILEKSLFILSEVASQATLSDEVIEAEREVVLDELRQRRTAYQRYSNKLWPALFEGAPYPIPVLRDRSIEINNVRTCRPDVIRNFYQKWYQPQNMAVIAVGDFDTERTSTLIEKYFGKIPSPQSPSVVETAYFPKTHKKPSFVIFSDPELMLTELLIHFQLPPIQRDGVAYLNNVKASLINQLLNNMLDMRFDDFTEDDDCSCIEVEGKDCELLNNIPFFAIAAVAKEEAPKQAFKEILTEIKRIKEHGFLPSELEHAKKELQAALEHTLEEEDAIAPKRYIEAYRDHFLKKSSLPEFTAVVKEKRAALSEIKLEEINAWASSKLSNKSLTISVLSPQKSELTPVSQEDLEKIIKEVSQTPVEPYSSPLIDSALMEDLPAPGKIVEAKQHGKADVTEYILENGMTVLVKPTSFESDQVRIYGQVRRGTRDVPLDDQPSAKFSHFFVNQCGLNGLDLPSLKKMMKGKHISWGVEVRRYVSAMEAFSSIKDLETAFQLCHLQMAKPRYDKRIFNRALKDLEESLRNRDNHPSIALADALTEVNTQNHAEFRPMTLKDLELIEYEKAKNFHQGTYSNPENFTFTIVGNVDAAKIKPLIEQYLASIPKKDAAKNTHSYSPVPFPTGIVTKNIYAGQESACTSIFSFPAAGSDTLTDNRLGMWSCELARIRLTSILRKQLGKTYSPHCTFLPNPIPGLNASSPPQSAVHITCDEANLQDVKEAMLAELKLLQEEGPTEQEVSDLKAWLKIQRRQVFNTNKGWLAVLANQSLWDIHPDRFDDCEKEIDALDCETVKQKMKTVFSLDNYTQVTLYPESSKPNLPPKS